MIDNVYIEYHITDKCNLNCKSCLHFCPLSNNEPHKSIGQIKFDLLSLSKFEIAELHLFGGEPLLHPDLMEICKFARKLFPNTLIIIISNGTMPISDEEIDILKKLNIYMQISIYPFRQNWKEYYKQYIHRIKDIIIKTNTDEEIDNMEQIRFQTKPLTNEQQFYDDETIRNCRMRFCIQLVDAKLYICPAIAYFKFFENAFKDQLNIKRTNINRTDYLDLIDENLTEKDVKNFIYNSIPSLCSYCKECNRWINTNMEWCNWERSNKTIDEWI